MWRFVAPRFAVTSRVVTFDHVGFGASDLSAFNPDRYTLMAFGGGNDRVVAAALLYRVLTFIPIVVVGATCALIWHRQTGGPPADEPDTPGESGRAAAG
jgi:pimeloyl-ACP methyl ester carboxylesterase